MTKPKMARVWFMTIAAAILLLTTAGMSWSVELLTNPGFENGVPSYNGDSCGGEGGFAGWIYSTIDPNPPVDPNTGLPFYPCSGFWNGGVTAWGGGTRVHTGTSAARGFHYGGLYNDYVGYRWSSVRQEVGVVPNKPYTASAWAYVWNDMNYAIGADSFFQLKVEELNASGAVVATHIQPITVVNEWANPAISFTSTAATVTVRYMLISRIYNYCTATHITWDDCSLDGQSPSALELLANPSFENGVWLANGDSCGGEITVANWTYSTINPFGASLCSGFWDGGATAWSGGTRTHQGASSVRAFSYGYVEGFWFSSVKQVAAVAPDGDYSASAWVYIWHDWAYPLDPASFVKFEVQELDAFNSPIGQPHTVAYDNSQANTNTWLNPAVEFHTTPETTKVEFKMSEYASDPYNKSHINWDDCSLSGPSPFTMQGTVTSGGSPVADVTVSAGLSSTLTLANGTYTMPVPAGGSGVTIRAAKTGYFTQKKIRTLQPGINTVNFDLMAAGSNLLKNPGFDDNSGHTPYEAVPDWWTLSPITGLYRESFFLDTGYGGWFQSGEEAAALICDTAPGTSQIHQTVTVQPNAPYTASAWVHAGGDGLNWYSGSDQQAAMIVQQLDRGGQVITEHKEYMTNFGDWQKLNYSFTSAGNAAMVKIIGWANILDDWSDTLGRAVFDSFELNGAAGSALPPLFGVVKTGTTVLPDSRVYSMSSGTTTTTDADGTWILSPPAGVHTLRVLKPGYYTQRRDVSSPSGNPVIFDLVAKGNNLLVNAGFDDHPYEGGWTEEPSGTGNGMRRDEWSFIASVLLPVYYVSGQEAICLFNTDSPNPGGCWYWQSVPVVGGQMYTAKVKTKISVADGTTTAWGIIGDEQVAGLKIEEYDAAGQPIPETLRFIPSQELPDWEQLSITFPATSATKSIKVGPYVWMLENARTTGWARATFDDVELNGQIGAYGLSGTVKSGTTAIAGAVVKVAELDGPTNTYITNASGQYTATTTYGGQYTIQVNKAGYYPQTKTTTVTGVNVVDFDLFAVGGNLLFNPNFDDPAGWLSGGWVPVPAVSVWPETHTAQYGPAHFFSVPQATFLRGPAATVRVYQDVPVLPNSSYAASVKFLAGTDARYGSVWGTDPTQIGALYVQELNAQKANIGTETRVNADVTLENRDEWKTLSTSIQTTSNTAYIRVGGYAYMVDNYDGNLARALFDNFALTGPAAGGQNLAQIKGLSDGSSVRLLGKIVTASFNGFFYIEEADRSNGIRVNGSANTGDVVDILGVITTVNGERLVSSSNIIQRMSSAIPRPLGSNSKSLNLGLSAVGLYMTVWGTVDSVSSDSFTISDGSGASLKVYGTAVANDYVSVTGAIGAEKPGTDVIPVMRAVQVKKQP